MGESELPRSQDIRLIGHPLGNHDWQPAMDPQPAEVGNFGQSPANRAKHGVGQHQRVAAAEDHLLESSDRRRFLARRAPNRIAAADDFRRESAAGSRSGNGRRTPQLLPSRFGLDTSAAGRARSRARPRRAGRHCSPAERPFRPPGAKPGAAAGRLDRRAGCGPGRAAATRSEKPPAAARPPLPTQGSRPSKPAKLGRAADRRRPRPIASRSGRTALPHEQFAYNLP